MSAPDPAMPETPGVATSMKPVTKFSAEHAKEIGLPSPEAINYMMSVASMLSSTALVTKDMGLSNDQIDQLKRAGFTPQDIEERIEKAVKGNSMAKMLIGRELSMEPMAALQDIDIVKAKIFVRYPQLLRLIEKKGCKWKQVERTHERAAIEITRPGEAPELFEFTFEDAKRAGLTESYRSGEKSQYEKRPRVMLWARVVSEAYRATGGRGNIYTPEEKAEILDDGETDRDRAEAAADAVAKDDPALRVEKKQLPAGDPAIDVKPEPTEPLKKVSAKAPAKSEAPKQPDKPVEEKKPALNEVNLRAQKIVEPFASKLENPLLSVAKMYQGYFGDDMPKTMEPYGEVLTHFEDALKYDADNVDRFCKDPLKFGQKLRKVADSMKQTAAAPEPITEPVPPETAALKPAVDAPTWSEYSKKLADAVVKKYAIKTPQAQFSALKLFDATEEERNALLLLYYFSPDTMLLRRRAAEKSISMLECLAIVNEKAGEVVTLDSNKEKVSNAILSAMTEIAGR